MRFWVLHLRPMAKPVLSGSYDRTLRLWDTDYHDFILYACERLTRDLTVDERLMYGILNTEPTLPRWFGGGSKIDKRPQYSAVSIPIPKGRGF